MRMLNLIGGNNPKVKGIGSEMDSSQLNDQMDVEENDDTGKETPQANAKQTEQKDDGQPAPSEKRCKQREMSDLERLLIDQNKERHEKEMMLLDIKVQNELLKSDILKKNEVGKRYCNSRQ